MGLYATATEIRNWTNVSSDEWSDAQVLQFVSGATKEIDARTGRTWQGIATESAKTFDGDGSRTLFLPHIEIQSVTSLGIDDDDDDVYTTISSNWYDVYGDAGILKLTASATPGTFVMGNKTVKVTYTYGNATPTDDVKMLCWEMVAQMIAPTDDRQERIKRKITELKQIGATMVDIGHAPQ